MKPWRSIKIEFDDGNELYIPRRDYDIAVKLLEDMEQVNEVEGVAKRLFVLLEKKKEKS